mgnify:CR=1 FL=1
MVLVTNVGLGFGRAAALAFGAAGADVVCADRDVEQASRTAAEIEEAGGQAIPVQADMSSQMDVINTFEKVFGIFGNLDGVVHVASHESSTPFRKLVDNEFGELLQETLRSTYLVLNQALRAPPDRLWISLIGPPRNAVEPQMAAIRGALGSLCESFNRRHSSRRTNLLVPNRAASDPRHDASIVSALRFLADQDDPGVGGQVLEVELPAPPRTTESLLPEVRAALDSNMRQDDLEAIHYSGYADEDDDDEDGPEDQLDEAAWHEDDQHEDYAYQDALALDDFKEQWESGLFREPRRDPVG